jgi:hypothetical protein
MKPTHADSTLCICCHVSVRTSSLGPSSAPLFRTGDNRCECSEKLKGLRKVINSVLNSDYLKPHERP